MSENEKDYGHATRAGTSEAQDLTEESRVAVTPEEVGAALKDSAREALREAGLPADATDSMLDVAAAAGRAMGEIDTPDADELPEWVCGDCGEPTCDDSLRRLGYGINQARSRAERIELLREFEECVRGDEWSDFATRDEGHKGSTSDALEGGTPDPKKEDSDKGATPTAPPKESEVADGEGESSRGGDEIARLALKAKTTIEGLRVDDDAVTNGAKILSAMATLDAIRKAATQATASSDDGEQSRSMDYGRPSDSNESRVAGGEAEARVAATCPECGGPMISPGMGNPPCCRQEIVLCPTAKTGWQIRLGVSMRECNRCHHIFAESEGIDGFCPECKGTSKPAVIATRDETSKDSTHDASGEAHAKPSEPEPIPDPQRTGPHD